MADEKKIYLTPKGTLGFADLDKPYQFVKDGVPQGKPMYKAQIILEAEDAQAVIDLFQPIVDEEYKNAFENAKPADKKKITKKSILEPEFDDQGNETGRYILSAKTQYKPLVVDSKKNKMPAKGIWGGSTVKLAYKIKPYFMASAKDVGIAFRLQGVQVIDLVSGGDGAVNVFGEEDGFVAEEGMFEEDTSDTSTDSSEDEGGEEFDI